MADLLLALHFLVAAFIVATLPLVWLGATLGWQWIRHPVLRYVHFAAILLVAVEALAGIACPLTVWEDLQRGGLRPESFVGRWLHAWLYYDVPDWVFACIYVAWAAATLITLRAVPPRRRAG